MTQTTEFKEQGGIATMDPSPLRRWIISKVMSTQASEKRMLKKRQKAERKRLKNEQPHVVEYFHQVDDGYSHLAAQALQALVARYDIDLRCHLVTAPTGDNVAEPELLLQLGVRDAKAIAPHYALTFPSINQLPAPENLTLTQSILAHQDTDNFLNNVAQVSQACWQNDNVALQQFAAELGNADEHITQEKITAGNDRRAQLKHYSGAMFYYAGEWYWGVDRLFHLEQRLRSLGADRTPEQADIMPQPKVVADNKQNAKDLSQDLTLEIYASLRSPYTAIVFDRAVELAKQTNINYVICPVLPMVMRGVPATKEKGLYILFDTAREARAAHVPYGNIKDPIGQPVRYGYALYHWAKKLNKGTAFFSNFLRAAFAEGINTNNHKGLQYVVEKTGLDWQQAKHHLNNTDWQSLLEDNRLTMYQDGLWGVPSFRLLNKQREEVLSCWGQDRLWLVALEIQRLSNAL